LSARDTHSYLRPGPHPRDRARLPADSALEPERGSYAADAVHTRLGRTVCRTDPDGADLFMIFTETELKGAFVLAPEMFEDERGFFARTWCQREFTERGLNPSVVQCSVSFSHKRGTLRGMHYQAAPHQEAK